MSESPRRTEYLPLSELKPDPRNPKNHSLETIDASIGRFGMVEAIVRDDRTGYIISGHGRAETLRRMAERGESPPEGIEVTESGEWLVPTFTGWASRTDTEAAAALIALNRTTELGGWVDEALLDLLDDLSAMDDGLEGVGFSDADLEHLHRVIQDLELSKQPAEGVPLEDEPIDLAAGLVELVVVVEESSREDFYALALEHQWIIDVRDKT